MDGVQDAGALGRGQIVEHVLGGTSSDGAHQVASTSVPTTDTIAMVRRLVGGTERNALRERHADGIGHPIENERLTRRYEPTHLTDNRGLPPVWFATASTSSAVGS